MAETPTHLRYAKSDEWFDPATGKIGISDYAQDQLSDVVFLEIRVGVGEVVAAGSIIASVESVKAASDVLAPAGGRVVAVNEALAGVPEALNRDPYGSWLIQLEGGVSGDLLDAPTYERHCTERN